MDPKSISGISIPQWMKGRANDQFGNDAAPFSPPTHDDPIFYIRYPQKQKTNSDIRTLIANETNAGETNNTVPVNKRSIFEKSQSTIDFSKHPCSQFMSSQDTQVTKGQKKSQGTDDGFDQMPCSQSILKVAKKVVKGRQGQGFTCAYLDEVNVENIEKNKNNIDIKEDEALFAGRSMLRRGSKSLPASPLSSPKLARKCNPYFTNTYTTITTGSENRGWLLSGLLGLKRESGITSSISSQIDEELDDLFDGVNDNNLNEKIITTPTTTTAATLKAKPSELREMNFWSPTSM